MSRKRRDEVRIIVGNRHLLFLFFTAAVSFPLFFFWGYTIGYGQGERSGPAESAALRETPETDPEEGMLPRTLLEDPPKVEAAVEPPAAAVAEAKPSAAQPVSAPQPAAPLSPAAQPAARKPAPRAAGKGLHLQVAALRMSKDAQALAGRLRERGYAAAVRKSPDSVWFRVVVGPFGSDKAAEAVRKKLGKDGFNPMTRRF